MRRRYARQGAAHETLHGLMHDRLRRWLAIRLLDGLQHGDLSVSDGIEQPALLGLLVQQHLRISSGSPHGVQDQFLDFDHERRWLTGTIQARRHILRQRCELFL